MPCSIYVQPYAQPKRQQEKLLRSSLLLLRCPESIEATAVYCISRKQKKVLINKPPSCSAPITNPRCASYADLDALSGFNTKACLPSRPITRYGPYGIDTP